MSGLDATRAELAIIVLYLKKSDARDKICRAIQYAAKFVSNGQPGTAQSIDKSTSMARKTFRLFKFINYLLAFISPTLKQTPLPLVLLGKLKNALLTIYFFLDHIVWLGRSGIYKNKERTTLLGQISLRFWMCSSTCTIIIEISEIGRLSASMKKLRKELHDADRHKVCNSITTLKNDADKYTTYNPVTALNNEADKYKDELYHNKLKRLNGRLITLIKASLDMVVAVGLLQLAPKKITPRVVGGIGFITSLIACYQLFPAPAKPKMP
ncbi:peroxisomal membrane protein 11E-like [Typha latifolia]|uniref:peroxisomal membrane protein 11E-like n=1 Tax=Typha latifolia TaxID=4733 RepID=UPI003C2D862A